MRCPHCATENPPQAAFCPECGMRLALACPSCGTDNPPQARFCLACGAPLAGPAPASAEGWPDPLVERLQRLVPRQYAERLRAAQGPVEHERRMVTILFADIKDSPQLQGLDAEDVMEIIDGALEALTAPVYRHEGTLARCTGDAMLAFFGAPIAHEDDPVRACRAALEVVAGVERYAARLVQVRGLALNVRVGINTGLVVVGEVGSDLRVEYTAMGDAVNVAARLQQAAPAGGILISHDTCRHVRGLFDLQSLDPIQVKGKDEPLRVYLLQRARPRTFHAAARGVEGVRTRMVGRDSELRALQSAWDATVAEAKTRAVTIAGEAGVGKSRLLYEFERWLQERREECTIFRGRAWPQLQSVPYSTIRDAFALRFDIRDTDSAAEALARFRDGMAGILDAERADLVGHLVGFDFSASPAVQKLLDSASLAPLAVAYLVSYFRDVAAAGPTAVLLEDLHWADSASLELVERLAAEIPAAPLLLLCLARPTLFERCPTWGRAWPTHTRLDLRPLSEGDSVALVDEILQKVAAVPEDLRRLITRSAEGNPFYVEEVIKMLVDDGVIVRGEEAWHVELGHLQQVRVPPTLTGVLQARLDSLPSGEKGVLQRAAVVGRHFWDSAVAHLAEPDARAGQEPAVDRLLHTLRRRELVFSLDRSAFSGSAEYAFQHAVLRDVTYETVLLQVRRAYHRRMAEWLEANCGERLNEYAGLIADHYERARLPDKAAFWLRRVGETAYRVSAYGEALAAYERALALTPKKEYAQRGRLLLDIGSAYDKLCDYEQAQRHLRDALELGRAQEDYRLAASALVGLRWVAGVQGRHEEAAALADEQLAMARKSGDRLAIAKAMADVAASRDDIPAIIQAYEERLAIHRQANELPGIAICYLNLGNLVGRQKDYAAAIRYYEESKALFEKLGNRWGTSNCLNNLGWAALQQQDYPATIRYCRESLATAREIHDHEGIVLTQTNIGYALANLGDLEPAMASFREALSAALASGLVPLALDVLAGVALARVRAGDLVGAAELLGLVRNHPVTGPELAESVAAQVAGLRAAMAEGQLAAALERGAALALEQAAAQILPHSSESGA